MSRYQKLVIAILGFLQFTIILDFIILSPLGAVLMPALHITPAQFGMVVSGYAFSAGISGLLAAGFADRFDRKKLLLFFYSGFILGTLLCGLAPNFEVLLLARIFTGVFGGVIGSIVFAIATDLFAPEVRGRVMGTIQTAFAASQVLGLPLGLYLSNLWGWHAPFLMIVAGAVIAGFVIVRFLKPVDGHLKLKQDKNPLQHLLATVRTPRYLHAFATTALVSTGGFMLMPFGSAYNVHNLGVTLDQLPIMYLITGTCSIIAGPYIGRAVDRYGGLRVFTTGSVITIMTTLIYARLGLTPFAGVAALSILLYLGVSARIIPLQAITSLIPDPASRGAFMAVSSSIQQVAGGLATMLGGLIVVPLANGGIGRFDVLGNVVVLAALITLGLLYTIPAARRRPAAIRPGPAVN